ncbi:hypothetical protein [Xanthobacter autotrophicus]|uniref:hypothetical protein n=1 Tax=Xanthobacter autotrophicus TaxID=280 RepID=UPI00372BF8B4
MLPACGLKLVVISFGNLTHNGAKRLLRGDARDMDAIRAALEKAGVLVLADGEVVGERVG